MSISRLVAHDGACLTFHSSIACGWKDHLRQLLSRDMTTLRQLKLDAWRVNHCSGPTVGLLVPRALSCTLPYKNAPKNWVPMVQIGATSCFWGLTGQSVPESTCRSNPTFLWFRGLWRICPRARRSEVQAACWSCRLMCRLISKAVD